ncbi:MAG: adenylosuccinate synthetase [Candidatus Pacebacteria bacterium]|nr:adenylosuccinate synthetase [Candidatus Paceibacterota bacterium]PIR60048.1 MAG: hypothetical protein COU67_03865 [Candidatus Pacebacteria bacterium CG10_big_fil_rev_8_21_14_0_10_44_54]
MPTRPRSFAFCGGAYGDEGKGRLVDQYVSDYAKQGRVVVYRDNGGSNAGHTVAFDNTKVALHQLLSGTFIEGVTTILGKGMVLHPGDLLEEIATVKAATGGGIPAKILIDEMAVVLLDTHRAYEAVLQDFRTGNRGTTGRGISPAYVDVLLRHPIRMRDFKPLNKKKLSEHYRLYQALCAGLGQELEEKEVPTLSGSKQKVGNETAFIKRAQAQAAELEQFISGVFDVVQDAWGDEKTTFVFEKGQAVGLDVRWGVYPDFTASETTFSGIFSSTEGVVNPRDIEVRAGVIKATYMSSVGIRQLPSVMDKKLADKIREDANEYGATTKRPRDIVYFDVPASAFFARVGDLTHLVATHMDIVYPNMPIKVCVAYLHNGKTVPYRPDQAYLHTVTPVYQEFAPWDVAQLKAAKTRADLPKEAQRYLEFLEKSLGVPMLAITTGPKREEGIEC